MNLISIVKQIGLLPFKPIDKVIKKTNWYRNVIPNIENYPGDSWYRNHLERNYDVVNLGSSSAVFCFNYDGLNIKAFNWALRPQSMEYSYKVLKQYFSILRPNGKVIIPFSPFSGLSIDGKWGTTANDKYYYILDRTLIDNFNEVSRRRNFPFLSYPIQSLKRLIRDVSEVDMYSYSVQCETQEDYKNSALKWIQLWKNEFSIDDLETPLSEALLPGRLSRMKTIVDMIHFCLDRELEPVIVIPPVHESLNIYFTPRFVRNYITTFIDELNMPELRVLDYLSHPLFTKDAYFRDAFFMNENGAKEFTKQVLKDLLLFDVS